MDDLVRRRSVLAICEEKYWNGFDDYNPISARGIAEKVKALESAQTEPKTGEWMGTVCSSCGESVSNYYDCDYCPKCGSKNELIIEMVWRVEGETDGDDRA